MGLTLKEFIVETLQNYNCGADSDVLADYVIALTESKDILELHDELQVFFQDHDSTGQFIKTLNEFLHKKEVEEHDNNNEGEAQEEEVEVDYEEDIEPVTMTVKQPHQSQRVLREYSPERRSDPSKAVAAVAQKQPCTNFSRYGNCRFSDNCRFSHIPTNQRRRNVSSRVKLSNLPPTVLSPTAITEIMKAYGSVVGVTVYPEKGEAVVQYVSGEEASAAIEGAVNDFESDDVIIELETMVPNKPKSHANHKHQGLNSDKLQSLISLQKQQQSLLESNLASQQSLLTHLQNPNLTAEEKTELMQTLKRVQESVMGVQEMVKKTTELVVEAASVSSRAPAYEKRPRAYEQPPRRPNPPNTSYNNAISNSHYSSNRYNSSYNYPPSNAIPANKFTLDLRPTTLRLSPLPLTAYPDIRSLQARFSPYGLIQSLILTEAGQTALIKYQKHADALKAMEGAGREFENIEGVEFKFVKLE